ncbi:MAG: hypothetical protein VXZ83_04730 [Verrucomicrobiota bacterium]|nr:hypothetical protein [Verrucomicrobiota bacterium]
MTDPHAIEVAFGDKQGQALGQSLNYTSQANTRVGILLILEKQSDEKHLIRVNPIIKYFSLPIDELANRALN